MRSRLFIGIVSGVLVLVAIAGFMTRGTWVPWVWTMEESNEENAAPGFASTDQVKLSAQARENLGLTSKPLVATTYWRTIQVPATVIDRPGFSDRGVVSPVTGVITRVHRVPGETVKPGDPLFTVHLVSESLHLAQTELFKTTQELQITQETKDRLTGLSNQGAIPGVKIIDLDNQLRRLKLSAQAFRLELQLRGLQPKQIDRAAEGAFVSEIQVLAPAPDPKKGDDPKKLAAAPKKADATPALELQELKVDLGQQVQAGQTLCLLSDHQRLLIEGRAFRLETALVERALKENWPVQVEFMEDKENDWPAFEQTFRVQTIANTIDPVSRTFGFHLALTNQSRAVERDGRTVMLWRFRPGQKVRLHVRVEKLDNVFVLPAGVSACTETPCPVALLLEPTEA